MRGLSCVACKAIKDNLSNYHRAMPHAVFSPSTFLLAFYNLLHFPKSVLHSPTTFQSRFTETPFCYKKNAFLVEGYHHFPPQILMNICIILFSSSQSPRSCCGNCLPTWMPIKELGRYVVFQQPRKYSLSRIRDQICASDSPPHLATLPGGHSQKPS